MTLLNRSVDFLYRCWCPYKQPKIDTYFTIDIVQPINLKRVVGQEVKTIGKDLKPCSMDAAELSI